MTEMLNKEFSRKSFVKGGGALIVGFSLAGAGLAGKASAAGVDPYASNGRRPVPDRLVDPDPRRQHGDDPTGGIRQGTGSDTGLLMIAGEELDMDMSQLKFVMADTGSDAEYRQPLGEQHDQEPGAGLRAAAASARQVLLGLASTQLGVPASQLSVSKGVVSGGGKSVTYGALLGGKLFNVSDAGKLGLEPDGRAQRRVQGTKPGYRARASWQARRRRSP